MPFKARKPMGGFKVMYEFANRLSDLGYSIHITYPIKTKYMEYRLPYVARKLMSYVEGFKTDKWFNFKPSITMSYVDSVSDRYVIDSDVIIATWWSTASDMGQLSQSKGVKINFIQGYENWIGHEDELHKSYNMPTTTNVVVASYLAKIVEKYSSTKAYLIPNAIDNKIYKLNVPIGQRDPFSICMLYSEQEIKGSKFGLESLFKVQEKYKDLKVDLFGIFPRPENLPSWIVYHRDPSDLVKIYNNNAIFIANSFTEGMALTPMEAMFCGCACILTDIDGHSEYGKNNETCLLYEPKNTEELINKINSFLDNNNERIKIATEANNFIQQFSWDKAVEKMNNIIQETLKKSNS